MFDMGGRPWAHWEDVYSALGGGAMNMKLASAVEARRLPAETYALDAGIAGDAHNPSVATRDGRLWVILRVLNKATYHTTNVLGELMDRRLTYKEPGDGPGAPRKDGPLVLSDETCGVTSRGHEDGRLFVYNGLFAISATVCNKDQTVGFSRPRMTMTNVGRGIILRSVPFASLRQEKNWMPCVEGSTLRFVYSVDPLIVLRFIDGITGVIPPATELPEVNGIIRGGSQLIPFRDGWLAVVHQAHRDGGIIYTHRFALFDKALTSVRLGAPFYFLKRGIEFCAGLAEWGGKFILSFGVDDRHAMIAEVAPAVVEEFLAGAVAPSAIMASEKTEPVESIGVFVTHYVPAEGFQGLNEILLDQILRMRAATHVDYETVVVHFAESAEGEAHLQAILPTDVTVVKCTRQPRPDIQPALRNTALDIARELHIAVMVLLHNDVRPARYWLERFLEDLHAGEKLYGRGNVIVSPRHIPYHYVPPARGEDEAFWKVLRDSPHVRSVEQMAPWCKLWSFPFDGTEVECPPWAPAPPHGHQLMMWCTRPGLFDAVGPCDETFVGFEYDDVDWGMRVLMAKKASLLSQSALVGHIEGLTFDKLPRLTNAPVFIAKWGQAVFDEMVTGRIWTRLRG